MTRLDHRTAPSATDDLDAQLLIPEARRRQRRRQLVMAAGILALAVVVGGALLITFSSGSKSRPSLTFQSNSSPLPARTSLAGTDLLAPGACSCWSVGGALGYAFHILHPATGALDSFHPFDANTEVTLPWASSGRELVDVIGLPTYFPNVGTAIAIGPGHPLHLRALGRATYVVDGSTPGDVWLVVNPYNGNQTSDEAGCTVEEISLDGTVDQPPRPFPCTWQIEGPAPTGLLVKTARLEQGRRTLRTWSPTLGRIDASYGFASNNLSIDGDSNGVALWNECDDPPLCVDEATDLATGRTTFLPGLPRGWNQLTRYSLSPSGQFAAVLAISERTQAALRRYHRFLSHSQPCCYYGVIAVQAELFVYGLEGDTLVESRPLLAASVPLLEWSPDGGWLFVTRDLQSIESVPMWSATAPIRLLRTTGTRRPQPEAETFLPFRS